MTFVLRNVFPENADQILESLDHSILTEGEVKDIPFIAYLDALRDIMGVKKWKKNLQNTKFSLKPIHFFDKINLDIPNLNKNLSWY